MPSRSKAHKAPNQNMHTLKGLNLCKRWARRWKEKDYNASMRLKKLTMIYLEIKMIRYKTNWNKGHMWTCIFHVHPHLTSRLTFYWWKIDFFFFKVKSCYLFFIFFIFIIFFKKGKTKWERKPCVTLSLEKSCLQKPNLNLGVRLPIDNVRWGAITPL